MHQTPCSTFCTRCFLVVIILHAGCYYIYFQQQKLNLICLPSYEGTEPGFELVCRRLIQKTAFPPSGFWLGSSHSGSKHILLCGWLYCFQSCQELCALSFGSHGVPSNGLEHCGWEKLKFRLVKSGLGKIITSNLPPLLRSLFHHLSAILE